MFHIVLKVDIQFKNSSCFFLHLYVYVAVDVNKCNNYYVKFPIIKSLENF